MIFRIIVRVFGSAWKLKSLCIESSSPTLKKILIKLYGAYQYESGSSIAWNSNFHGIPCFPHGMKSIFISGGSEIGKNCVIFQQVTIGSNTLGDSKNFGAPKIGDNCYIGAGAKIIGKVTIGNNVRVGANAVVYQDVPDNSVVTFGEQRTILKKEPLDNHFYSFQGRWSYFEDGAYVAVHDELLLNKFNGNSHH